VAKRFVVVTASVGAGHDGAAHELIRRLTAAGHQTECYNLLDLLPGSLAWVLRDGYHWQLRAMPRTWDWAHDRLARSGRLGMAIKTLSRVAAQRLSTVLGGDVAAVISTYPVAGQALGRLRREGRLGAPVLTYLTDLSVHPLWIADGVDEYLALHHVSAALARSQTGAPVSLVAPAVAPDFGPAFHRDDKALARARFGLPLDKRLALVVAGSWGVGEIVQSATEIGATGLATPVVACAGNDALRMRLLTSGKAIALPWVSEMATLIRACDVVINNSGGLTSLQALASRVPVVTHRSLPGHGRANAAGLDQAGLAAWIREPGSLARTLASVFSGELATAQNGAAALMFAGPDPAEVITTLARLGRRHGPLAVNIARQRNARQRTARSTDAWERV
jgi:processive 1,2-diacylglycerol beta-glucosyltransferase